MPTGYTAGVQDGTITDFADYAMKCARNFGALVLMRDDPLDKQIPDEFQPSDWNLKRLEEARTELARLKSLSAEEIAAECKAANTAASRGFFQSRNKNRQERERYEAMLEKAKAYAPPSADHENFAKFLVTQLEESIQFDCHEIDEPEMLSVDGWYAIQVAKCERDIKYHTEHHAEDVERTNSRNRWVRQLRESLQSNPQGA